MRVLHVIPSVAERYGGPSVAIRAMATSLAARGHEVTVATTNADGAGKLDVPTERAVRDAGADYVFFERSALAGEWKFSLPLTRWLWRHVGDYEVVHVHALFSYATIPACRLAHAAGVPYVLRPLGTLTQWSLASKGWKKAPYLRLVERAHIRRAAAIHVTSGDEAASLAALGYGALARIIPLGVAPPLADVDAAIAARAARRDEPLRLLFLSRLHPKKRLPLLLTALAEVVRESPELARLTVAGGGDAPYEAELAALVESLDLRSHVTFTGAVSGDAKAAVFAESDAFVLPSDDENFGIAAAEALAAGLPVILSDRVAIAAEAEAAGAGLMVTRDTDSVATAIRRMARDAPRRDEMARSAVRVARERYSWARVAAELEELYERVARDRRARAAS